MQYVVKRKDIKGDELIFLRNIWGGNLNILQEGKKLEQTKEKNSPLLVLMKSGDKKKLFVKTRWLDPVPQVYLEEEEILLAENLRFIDHFFATFPIMMYLALGPLPTVLGFFILLSNYQILRSKWSPSLKWTIIYGLDISVYSILFLIAKLIWR